MRTAHLIALSVGFFLIGTLFLAYQLEWIIIRSPFATKSAFHTQPGMSKQTIQFWYWQSQFKATSQELIVPDTQQKAFQILSSWLTFLHEEKILKFPVQIESVFFDPTGNYLYISFDASPFEAQQSVYQKLKFIESLKKTIQTNGIKANGIYLLSHHKVLQDDHLDFNKAWILD